MKYIYIVNSWEWTQNIPHKPVKKGSKRVWETANTCFMHEGEEDSKANVSLHKKRCLTFTFPHHKASLHTFKDPVILLFVPNSHPANPTLLPDFCFSSGTGIVYTTAPEVRSQTEDWDHSWWEIKNMHPSRPKRFQWCSQTLSFTDGHGLEDWGIGWGNKEGSQI